METKLKQLFVLCDRPGESSVVRKTVGCGSTLKMTTTQSSIIVFLKTTLTRTITQDKQVIPLGSNHLPKIKHQLIFA